MDMQGSRPLTVTQQQAVCQALEAASAQIREQAAQVAASWTAAQHSQAGPTSQASVSGH